MGYGTRGEEGCVSFGCNDDVVVGVVVDVVVDAVVFAVVDAAADPAAVITTIPFIDTTTVSSSSSLNISDTNTHGTLRHFVRH